MRPVTANENVGGAASYILTATTCSQETGRCIGLHDCQALQVSLEPCNKPVAGSSALTGDPTQYRTNQRIATG